MFVFAKQHLLELQIFKEFPEEILQCQIYQIHYINHYIAYYDLWDRIIVSSKFVHSILRYFYSQKSW